MEIYLLLETHFESRKIRLQLDQSQQDAHELKARLSSAEVNYVVKRAMLWAAACLVSGSEYFNKIGQEVLEDIDVLERSVQASIISQLL